MVTQNQKLFDDFLRVHTNFVINQEKHAAQFHDEGRDVLDIIRFWERKLCSGMEKGKNGQYSSKVAEKFWDESLFQSPLPENKLNPQMLMCL